MPEHKETRVVMRMGARELSPEELKVISGSGAPCQITFSHPPGGGTDEDTQCPGPA
jgi:hypothetical protein